MVRAQTLNAMTQWVKRNPLLGGAVIILVGFFIFTDGVAQGRKASLIQRSPTFEATVEKLTMEASGESSLRFVANLAYVGPDGARRRCHTQVKSKLARSLSSGSRIDVKSPAGSPDDCILATEAAGEAVFHLGRTPMSGLSFFGMGIVLLGLAAVIFRNRFLGDPD